MRMTMPRAAKTRRDSNRNLDGVPLDRRRDYRGTSELFTTKSLDGIDSYRAPRRNGARDNDDKKQQNCGSQ
jgi:hypothetical protein